MIILKRLRELRKSKGITAKELGRIINVAESTVSLYENGKRAPDYGTLLKIADFFSVSTDFLLEREEKENLSAPEKQLPDILYRVLDLSDEKQKEVFAFIEFKEMQQKREDQ